MLTIELRLCLVVASHLGDAMNGRRATVVEGDGMRPAAGPASGVWPTAAMLPEICKISSRIPELSLPSQNALAKILPRYDHRFYLVLVNATSVKGEKTMLESITIVQATPEMIHNWGWLLTFGIVLMVLGVAAMIRSFAATVASMMFFGWMLLFAGVVELIDAFMVGHWGGFFLHLLTSILFIVTGFLLVIKPVVSAEVATLVMSMFFLIGGLYEFVASLWTHLSGWGWHAFNGAISALMGILLLAQWPLTGLWAIGLFIGIDLIFAGWSWVALALDLRKM